MSDFESEQKWLWQRLKFWQWLCWGFGYTGIWHWICVSWLFGLRFFTFGEIPSNTTTHPQKTWAFRGFCSAIRLYKLWGLSSQYRWVLGGHCATSRKEWVWFPMVSLEFFIDIILRPHFDPGIDSGFKIKPCISLSSPPVRATCPAHRILLEFITRTILGEEYRSLSSSLCSSLHSLITSSLLGQYNLLNTLFSDTLSLRSSLNVSYKISHPYKTTGKIVVLYI